MDRHAVLGVHRVLSGNGGTQAGSLVTEKCLCCQHRVDDSCERLDKLGGLHRALDKPAPDWREPSTAPAVWR